MDYGLYYTCTRIVKDAFRSVNYISRVMLQIVASRYSLTIIIYDGRMFIVQGPEPTQVKHHSGAPL